MQSDYSPSQSSRELEAEYHQMLCMALFLAGVQIEIINDFGMLQKQADESFQQGLGEPALETDEGVLVHSAAQLLAARDESQPYVDALEKILAGVGISLYCELLQESTENNHAVVRTNIYTSYSDMKPVALIHRPLTDQEESMFRAYSFGYTSFHAKAAN